VCVLNGNNSCLLSSGEGENAITVAWVKNLAQNENASEKRHVGSQETRLLFDLTGENLAQTQM
jgi:hypothetical protein